MKHGWVNPDYLQALVLEGLVSKLDSRVNPLPHPKKRNRLVQNVVGCGKGSVRPLSDFVPKRDCLFVICVIGHFERVPGPRV